jgi:hypothetical protein
MPNLLSQLTKGERARLLEELNYMNLEEVHRFCSGHGIPYKVMAEHSDGRVRSTKDTDRKPIVLARLRHYLTTGDVGQPTRVPAEIVREDGPPARPGQSANPSEDWQLKKQPSSVQSCAYTAPA